jgi:pimeloyl-ACP methyl ester carboxylesterase
MELHVRRYGSGSPLLILHGLFGSLNNWHSFARSLEDRFTVVAVDLRNHGSSPHHDNATYEAMADDIRELLEQQSLARVHLLGHSMGGKVAMLVASLWPASVDHLIVVDIAPRRYAPGHDAVLEALLAFRPGAYSSREEADAALTPLLPEHSARQFLLANLVRTPAGTYRWRMNVPALHRAYGDLLDPITMSSPFMGPTLFVRGERSHYIGPSDETAIRSLFPSSRIVTVPEAGHWVHVDNPEVFRQTVRDFLP